MNVLLLNAGSSSLKAALMESADGNVIASGLGDWAGSVTHYQFAGPDGSERKEEVAWKGHAKAVERFVSDLTAAQRSSLAAVGHRVVHGGKFTSSVRITPEIRSRITELADLAPLHNPPSLETLAAAEKLLPHLPHVAVFDTAFHATLPPEAYTYPVPQKWTREWGIRKYGFHGLSHAYCAKRAAEMLGQAAPRLVICHLGHGCSASAVRGGKCVDTTMGFTPLDGLMMATRSGAVDPSIVLHLQEHRGLTAAQVETALNRESGLLGVSGSTADMRQILAAAKNGDDQARLALGIYAHRVRQAIGAFAVTLGGVDGLVFTAGVGEHSAEVRALICTGLECVGLELDPKANTGCRPDADVAAAGSRGRILVISTREDVTMLHDVVAVLAKN
jgi:acetate kinase